MLFVTEVRTHCCCFQAYYRQGVALQCLGRHADALGAFASALAQDDKSPQLLTSLTEAAMKSPLRGKLCNRCVILRSRLSVSQEGKYLSCVHKPDIYPLIRLSTGRAQAGEIIP